MKNDKSTMLKQFAQFVGGTSNSALSSICRVGATALLSLTAFNANAFSYMDGKPSLDEPAQVDGVYQISTLNQLYWLSDTVARSAEPNAEINARLVNDIEWNPVYFWEPIGTAEHKFSGNFNGAGYTISYLKTANDVAEGVGLFGYTEGATIDSVKISNCEFYGKAYIGTIAGVSENSSISNCVVGSSSSNQVSVSHGNTTDKKCFGGICGKTYGGSISDCEVDTKVFAFADSLGGISGASFGTAISRCAIKGEVFGIRFVGGIVGVMDEEASVNDSYALNNRISGAEKVGAIAGNLADHSKIGTSYAYNVAVYVFDEFDNKVLTPVMFGESSDESSVTNTFFYHPSIEGAKEIREQFQSGEICYALNNKASKGDIAWAQTIGTDTLPHFFPGDTLYHFIIKGEDHYTNDPTVIEEGMLHLTDAEDFVPDFLGEKELEYGADYVRGPMSSNFGTLCLPFAYKASSIETEGVTLYTIASIASTSKYLTLDKIDDDEEIEAGKPVIFYAKNPSEGLKVVATGSSVVSATVADAFLTGTFSSDVVATDADKKFYLKDNTFYKGNVTFNVGRFRAFIHDAYVNNKLESLDILIEGLTEVETDDAAEVNATVVGVYNLAGQQVSAPRNGQVYILRMSDGSSRKAIFE
ncbi:MAG: hypothetical protein MJZ23_04340 [Paludibacteraceae bacterium]|nr:hypothetical protein [Paludibacteraceae bacterium]